MPWKECKPMDERLRFIARLLEGEQMASLCREFGISRVTGYKIYNRYKDCGLDALNDRTARAAVRLGGNPRLLFAPCVDRVQSHLAAGDKIVLVSGTLDIIATTLAHSLGIDDAMGTRCAVEAGRYTAKPPLLHPFGVAKKEIAKQLSRDFLISSENTVALANSRSDLPLLEMASTAVAVRPDSRLQRVARSLHWEVIRQKKQRLEWLKGPGSEQRVYERRDS
jgi:phosphoserine phosphatase